MDSSFRVSINEQSPGLQSSTYWFHSNSWIKTEWQINVIKKITIRHYWKTCEYSPFWNIKIICLFTFWRKVNHSYLTWYRINTSQRRLLFPSLKTVWVHNLIHKQVSISSWYHQCEISVSDLKWKYKDGLKDKGRIVQSIIKYQRPSTSWLKDGNNDHSFHFSLVLSHIMIKSLNALWCERKSLLSNLYRESINAYSYYFFRFFFNLCFIE